MKIQRRNSSIQQTFCPLDYGFEFTADWYEFDRKTASKKAMAERNAEAKKLRKDGWKVRCFSMPNQLVSRGGIGSGNLHIEEWVTVYGLNADKV